MILAAVIGGVVIIMVAAGGLCVPLYQTRAEALENHQLERLTGSSNGVRSARPIRQSP
jgi:hypothetical protein